MSEQFEGFEVHVMWDSQFPSASDCAPWLAIRHVACETFLSNGKSDGWDMLSVDYLVGLIKTHICSAGGVG